jgi:hypothetical protein
MYNLIEGGVVKQQFASNPGFASGIQVVNDNGQGGVAVGWTYSDGVFAAPSTPALTKTQLCTFADAKLAGILSTSRAYAPNGATVVTLGVNPMTGNPSAGTSIVDDAGVSTAANMTQLSASLATLTYPFLYSDEEYTVWSMSEPQLAELIAQVVVYGASVWAFFNGTVVAGIHAGSITTYAQIDSADWPT